VIGAPKNKSIAVSVSSMWANGKTVTNEYDGTTAVVTNGKATFNSGSQGVILISGPQSTINMSVKGEGYAFYDSQNITVKLRGADYAMASVDGGTPFRVVNGQTFSIGDGIELGKVFEVKLTASNSVETAEKSFTFKKKDPNAVTRVYFDNSSYNWNGINIFSVPSLANKGSVNYSYITMSGTSKTTKSVTAANVQKANFIAYNHRAFAKVDLLSMVKAFDSHSFPGVEINSCVTSGFGAIYGKHIIVDKSAAS
jgi:hypothetical protein